MDSGQECGKALEARLKDFNSFQECIVERVEFSRFRTRLEIVINYIWDDGGRVRTDIDERQVLYRLTFDPVFEVRFVSGLTAYQSSHLDELNWGLNEISRITPLDIQQDQEQYAGFPGMIQGVSVQWSWNTTSAEHDRRIDVVFSNLEIARI